jgi:signal transduction histidine kinase
MLDDPHVVQEMAGRISQIVDSAQGLTKGSDILSSSVAIGDIWKYSRETFSARLSEKGQTLETSGDSGLEVEADLAVLCNSILGKFLSNAIKFSPRGATIRMTAESAGDKVRVAVFDEGPGFPEDLLEQGPGSPRRQSIVGTEGEPGSGYGLQIAALCAARMNGSLEIRGKGPGGAISVLLPRPLDAR